MPNNLVFWQIIPFGDANLPASEAFFAHVYGALGSLSMIEIPLILIKTVSVIHVFAKPNI